MVISNVRMEEKKGEQKSYMFLAAAAHVAEGQFI